MPAKHKFQAYPGEVTWQKLEDIRKYETEKSNVKITDSWLLQNFVEVRHELIASGVTNRQRLGGVVDELSAVRAEIIELKQTIEMLAALIKGEKEDVRPDDN
jgi:hypothetical protein